MQTEQRNTINAFWSFKKANNFAYWYISRWQISKAMKGTIKGYDIGNVQATVLTTGLPTDETALTLFPTDVPGDILYPVCVKADGNCLHYTGSVIAFGNDNHAIEIRVRIIVKLALNSDLHLSQEYLQRGLSCPSKVYLAKSYAMYSEEYVHDENLD